MAHETAADVDLQLSFLPNECVNALHTEQDSTSEVTEWMTFCMDFCRTLVWQQGPAIGTGRFGHVVLALRIPSADLLAVKQIFVQEEVAQGNDTSSLGMQRVVPLAKIQREVAIVQSLQHPNIVHCLGCERYGPLYRIFMEFVPAGSLSKLLKELGPFPESAARHFVRQLTDGVAYLHRMGVAHRDLKCANLLLTGDGTVKIADFGSATRATDKHLNECQSDDDEFVHKDETARSVREGLGSPYWMAPELVRAERGEDGWRKADVWGIGCVLIELVTAKPPWDNHSNPLTAMFHIASREEIPSIPAAMSESARSFLLCCFQKDPTTRPSATELLTHPFLTGDAGALARWHVGVAHQTKEAAPNSPDGDSQRVEKDTQPRPPSHSQPQHSESVGESQSRRESIASSDSSEAAKEEDHGANAYSSDDASDQENQDMVPQTVAPLVSRRPSATAFTGRAIGRVRALAEYTAGDTNELSLETGQTLMVSGVNEFGWWRGRHATDNTEVEMPPIIAQIGWFPCTYVEWVHGTEPFQAKRPHLVDDARVAAEELAVAVGDDVDVVHCDWREGRLWAFGTLLINGHQGWFPFSCVVDERSELYSEDPTVYN